MTLASPELPKQSSPGGKCAVTAPVAPSSSCYTCSCTLAAGTMQPPRLLLFLFLLFLLPGMWADPEGSCKLHIFQTFVFHDTNFVDISSWATLEDIVFATLQKYTWNILHPWVYQALPAAEWENLQNLFSIYMHNFILSMSSDARLYHTPYPFVFQCATGCDLYPNGSYTKFYHLAYNTHDFLSFDVDNSRWERWQESELAAQVERQFNAFTGFSVTLQHLLNVTCVEHMKKFIKYGRATLERQEPPVARVFTRTPTPHQLLLVCRVTGFYPRSISVAWLQDGQEVPPGPALNTSTILPNADLTYQLRSVLAVAPHDGHSYACRVRHSSLGTRSLLIPWGNSEVVLIAGLGAGLLAAVATAAITVLWVWRCRKHQQMEESESRNSILSKEA